MAFVLTDALHDHAQSAPEREAVVSRGERLSYGELEAQSNQVCRVLLDQGVQRGDRVGLYLDKGVQSILSLYGILKTGACAVPIDPHAEGEGLKRLCRHADIAWLITSPNKRRHVVALASDPDSPLKSLLGMPPLDGLRIRTVSWDRIALADDAAVTGRALDLDLALLLYPQQALTAAPLKGAIHTHGSILTFAQWAQKTFALTTQDRLASQAPLHTHHALFDVFASVLGGAAQVLIPEDLLRLPSAHVHHLREQALTVCLTTPATLIQWRFRGGLEERDLPSLRHLICGGRPPSPVHLADLLNHLPDTHASVLFGSAEIPGATLYQIPQPLTDRFMPLPIGAPLRHIDAITVDAEDQVVDGDSPGELLVRTSGMFQGYWNEPDLETSAFAERSCEGKYTHYYHCTGWVGQRLRDGNVRLLGDRAREVTVRDKRIGLDAVEAALATIPAIEEAAVYALPDDRDQTVIEAAVLLQPEAEHVTGTSLQDALRDRLPAEAIPRRIRIEITLPRITGGEIDHEALAKRAQQGH